MQRPLLPFLAFLLLAAPLAADTQDTPAAPSQPEVEVTSGLSSPYVRNGRTVNFWLRIVNHSSHAISNLRVGPLDAPRHFSIVACWAADPRSKDFPAPDGTCPAAPLTLKPSQEVSLGGTIHAFRRANQQNIGAIVQWTALAPSSHEVILGPLSSDSWFTYYLETHTVLVSFFGVALLAGLAYLLKFKFESWRQRKERELARQAETWTQLLKEAGNFSLNYYLPADGALVNFLAKAREHLKLFEAAPETDPQVHLTARLAFFHWASFERRMLQIQRRIHGIHFKNQTAEDIVINAYGRFGSLFYFQTQRSREILDALLDKVPLQATSAKFLRLLDGSPPYVPADPDVTAAWDMFHSWLHGDQANEALRFLEAMQPIFLFEINRPYYYWYGQMDALDLSDDHLADLRRLVPYPPPDAHAEMTATQRAEEKDWHCKLDEYIEGTKKAG